MFKKFVAAAALSALTTLANAAPITITQVFSDVVVDDYGMPGGLTYGNTGSGDWIFKATMDTDAVNLSPWPGVYASYAATVTLTQASLGLFDELITNMRFFYVQMDMLGFAEQAFGGFPATRSEQFGIPLNTGHFPLAAGDVFHSNFYPSLNGFEASYNGFQFDNGARIYGKGYNAKSTITVADAAAVPEPAGVLLMFGALAGLALARRRQNKA